MKLTIIADGLDVDQIVEVRHDLETKTLGEGQRTIIEVAGAGTLTVDVLKVRIEPETKPSKPTKPTGRRGGEGEGGIESGTGGM